jgi:hypothetical protein
VNNLRIAFWKVERIVLLQGRWYGFLVFNPAFDHRRLFECGLRSVKRFLVTSSAGDDYAIRLFCGPKLVLVKGLKMRPRCKVMRQGCFTVIEPWQLGARTVSGSAITLQFWHYIQLLRSST